MTSPSDGLVPWGGRAGDIRVGSVLQGDTKAKKDVWEVIDTRNPHQYDLGQTPWFRARRLGTEEVVAIPPKTVRSRVTFMLTPEDFEFAETYGHPPARPKVMLADAEEVALLVEQLGASHLATRDHETGEIWCPSYASGHTMTGWQNRATEELAHLRLCHGMDVTALELMEWEEQMNTVTKVHGKAHFDNQPGGFPHRHVPEDLSIL